MPIKILNKEIIEKIAAGEVVERPSSVVKELLENSIDAGATSITVEIQNGGTTYIRVTDNGIGMSEEDAKLCFTAHATSKINSELDLFSISTLGFRGEALSSICAVGKVTLCTRTKSGEAAIKLVNHGGNMVSCEKCGKPEGSSIIVEDLFFNVPARFKFLKKPASEASYISNIIQKYILARPDISFRFISGDKDVYFSRGDGNLKNAIHTIYGDSVYQNLIYVDYSYDDVKIQGYIGEPSIARGTKSAQNLFINGRYIKSDVIASSIKQGYENRIMPVKHPMFVLSLTLPFDAIDVNVHPNKLEVRFKEEALIQECFFKAVKEAFVMERESEEIACTHTESIERLTNNESIDTLAKQELKKSLIDSVNLSVKADIPKLNTSTFAAQSSGILDRQKEYVQTEVEYSNIPEKKVVVVSSDNRDPKPPSQRELQLDLSDQIGDYRIIGQLFNTYILFEYKENFLIIDQHAAHERINTDKYLNQMESSSILKQRLLIPETIQLTNEDFATVMECAQDFENLGFEIEEFGVNVIRVNSVPHIFGENDIRGFFFETLDTIKLNPKLETRKSTIFQMACKHSIKAGQSLSDEQIKYILSKSLDMKTPLHCPHGRPIIIIKSKKEIEKWFMRIV